MRFGEHTYSPGAFCMPTHRPSVKVYNIALNPVDSYITQLSIPPGRVVGSDIAGTVDKVGEAVTQWKIGDRVAGFLQGGKSYTIQFSMPHVQFLAYI